jgi:protein-tyrosine phosphatase
MIDLHNHILWGADDGARTLGDSLEMCRMAHTDGIRTIVATPHTLNSLYQNDRPSILAKVRELNEVISNQLLVNSNQESGISYQLPVTSSNNQSLITNNKSLITNNQSLITNNQSQLRILPGADVHLCEETLPQLDGGKVTTIGDGGKYLLIEFPFNAIPYGAEEMLFQLMTRGIIPIISHPERNLEVKQNPQRYCKMIQTGCLGQVTAMSLTGGFGPESKRVAEQLLSKGLVHIIASDAHSTDGRPPVLSPAVSAAAKILGEEEALRMVTEYPQAVLEGRKPDFRLMPT